MKGVIHLCAQGLCMGEAHVRVHVEGMRPFMLCKGHWDELVTRARELGSEGRIACTEVNAPWPPSSC